MHFSAKLRVTSVCLCETCIYSFLRESTGFSTAAFIERALMVSQATMRTTMAAARKISGSNAVR